MTTDGGARSEFPLVALVLLAALVIRLPHFGDPFIRPHEAENAAYGLAARNHLRHGLGVTLGANCWSTGAEAPAPSDFYLNHPGTLSVAIAASYAAFGESEAATRLAPLLFCLIGLGLFHHALRRRFDARTALVALAAAAFAPSWIYFGKLATHLPLEAPLAILLADRYGDERAGPFELGLVAFFASAIDFGGALILPALLLAYGPRRRLIQVAFGVALAIALFAAVDIRLGGLASLEALARQGAFRAGAGSGLDVVTFLRTQLVTHLALSTFTPLGAIIAAAGFFFIERPLTERMRFLLALFFWGAGYILVFPEAAQVHDYWQYLLVPAAAILFALAIARLPRPVAALAIILFLDQSLRIVEHRYYADIGWYDREFAAIAWAKEHAGSAREIWTKEEMRTKHPEYYADRRFVHHPELADSFSLPSPAER